MSLECPVCGLRRVMQFSNAYRCTACKRTFSPAEFALLARQVVKAGMEAGK